MNYTMYTTLGLVERVKYSFYVTAENGVSNVGSTTPLPVLISEASNNGVSTVGLTTPLPVLIGDVSSNSKSISINDIVIALVIAGISMF